MLAIQNLTVFYGAIAGCQEISLEVGQGEAVALIGPNGAGKTTTLSAIVGLVRPVTGTIQYEGHSILGLAPERIVRQGIALVPEGRRIFGSLTVAENLRLAQFRRDSNNSADIDKVLDRFPGLKPHVDEPAARLSGGEQQQLSIARALLTRPKLLLLDEPSLGLAPVMVDRVFDALSELRLTGMTILIVEQSTERAIEFADRTYVMRRGRLVLVGSRDEIAKRSDLAFMYLGG